MRKKKIAHSLGLRLAIIISSTLFVLSLFLVFWVERQQIETIRVEDAFQANTLATTLNRSLNILMLDGSGTLVREWLDNLRGTEGIIHIDILRPNMKRAFLDLETINSVNDYLNEPRFHRELITSSSSLEVPRQQFQDALKGQVAFDLKHPGRITILEPINHEPKCVQCHGYDKEPIRGVLYLTLSTEAAQERINEMRYNLWGIYAVMALLVGLVLWIALRFNVLRPIAQFHEAIGKVARGDRDALVPVKRHDELGELAIVFNSMQKDLRTSEARIKAINETRIKAIMDNVIDGIFTMDNHGIIESFNPASEQIFGYSLNEIVGQHVKILMSAPYRTADGDSVVDYLGTGQNGISGMRREFVGRCKNGTTFPMEIAISDIHLDKEHVYIGIVRDITLRKKQTAVIEYQALHDSLTGLPNRNLFFDRLQQAIRAAQREVKNVAVLLMDLNHFKEINDTLGHQAGDVLLQQIALCLQKQIRESDTFARLGGDEFVMLLPALSDIKDVRMMAEKILYSLKEPFTINEQDLDIDASIGIVLYPQHGKDVNTLLQRADVAMYSAKQSGQGFVFYDVAKDQHSLRRLTLTNDIRHAIDNDELILHYQPKVDMKTGSVIGVEALVRWQHPTSGLIPPKEFIPIIEQTRVIKPLTLWVLNAALHQSYLMNQDGMNGNMAINLSARNLADHLLVETIKSLLDKWKIASNSLTLEITESALMLDTVRAINTIKKLNEMGIKFSIDDFGIGYSSMTHLKKLPVEEIKIDLSFVGGMLKDNNDKVIVRSIIELGHNLGIKVIAEGVCDKEIWNLLSDLGCDTAQGHYISHPLSASDLTEWLKKSKKFNP